MAVNVLSIRLENGGTTWSIKLKRQKLPYAMTDTSLRVKIQGVQNLIDIPKKDIHSATPKGLF